MADEVFEESFFVIWAWVDQCFEVVVYPRKVFPLIEFWEIVAADDEAEIVFGKCVFEDAERSVGV